MDKGEIIDHVIYHPRLDDELFEEEQLPVIGENVLFAWDQRPRIGQVMAVNTRDKKAVTVRLWKPSTKARSWAHARFRLDPSEGEQTDWLRIEPPRIQARQIGFDSEGYLDQQSRKTFKKLVKGRVLRSSLATNPTSKTSPRPHTSTTKKLTKQRATAAPKVAHSNQLPSHRYDLRSRGRPP